MTAYQITSMMEGVVTRGTAAGKIKLDRPVAGKTGTSNEEKDAWFVGYTPDLVAGVYIGFDNTGSHGPRLDRWFARSPVFNEFMQMATANTPPGQFLRARRHELHSVNRTTGMFAYEASRTRFIEAFKPGTGPADSLSIIGMDGYAPPEEILRDSPQANQAVTSGSGGLF